MFNFFLERSRLRSNAENSAHSDSSSRVIRLWADVELTKIIETEVTMWPNLGAEEIVRMIKVPMPKF